jgi:polyisoprenoid-binding protein YceI
MIALLLASLANAAPVTYELQPDASDLYVIIYNDDDRWTPVQGHDHVVVATTFAGSVTWDVEDAAACRVAISFPVTALEIDPEGARARVGLGPDGIDDGAKETATNNMLGKQNLNVARFANISYQSSKCGSATGTVDVTGTMTMAGVGKEVTVPMAIEVTDDKFSAKGTVTLKHKDFGMSPFTYGPLTPKNQEKLTFVIEVVGKPK